MPISHAHIGVRHARTLLKDVANCGVQPPKVLVDLVDAFDDLAKTAAASSDPTSDLVKAVAAGQLRGKELDKQIAQAAAAIQVQEFRRGLQGRVEPAVIRQFVAALDEGAADAIIDSLREPFDSAAAELAACAEVVNPSDDPETFLASATAQQIKAWQAIDEHIETLTKISSAVTHFGPHSTSFPLSEIPGNISSGTGFINNNGVMCVDPQWGLERGCQLFLNHGTHRNSPWFKGASMIRLNSIAEAREKIRAWSEAAWDGLNINRGRGRFGPDQGFIAEPVANPYKLAEAKG